MKFFDYFASLLPSFERSRITEDVDQLRREVKDNLIPAYKNAASIMNGKAFAAQITNDFNGLFLYALPDYKRVGFVEGTSMLLQTLPAKLDLVRKLVEDTFAKDVTKDSVTYRRAAVLRYLEIARFASTYASRSLLRYLAAEQLTVLGRPQTIDTQMAPMELKWLDINKNAYFEALKLLAIDVRHLEQQINSIPEINLGDGERHETLKQTVGGDKLDPLRMNLISARFNPIYHLRLVVAEWQVSLYKAQLEEKRALEFRLLALRKAYEGAEDAAVQKQIEYHEGRLTKLNAALAKQEEDYA